MKFPVSHVLPYLGGNLHTEAEKIYFNQSQNKQLKVALAKSIYFNAFVLDNTKSLTSHSAEKS